MAAEDDPDASLASRVERLERRVADLEGAAADEGRSGPSDPGDFWALHELQHRMPDGGAVLFTGDVSLPCGERWSWQEGASAEQALAADWSQASAALTALHHPVRLALLQAVLNGTDTVADLVSMEGFGTSGQVYHHIRALVAAGWLATARRGRYAVPGHRVVPLLVIVSAAQGH